MPKSYSIRIGDKVVNIPLPSFLGGRAKSNDVPVSIGHGIDLKVQRKNQLDELERQLENVGKSEMERKVFDD